MATDYKMTWREGSGGRWRKRYKGRDYYFPRKEGERKEKSYTRCYHEWLKKKNEIDLEAEKEAARAAELSESQYRDKIHESIERMKEIQSGDGLSPQERFEWEERLWIVRELESKMAEQIPYGAEEPIVLIDGETSEETTIRQPTPAIAPWKYRKIGDDFETQLDKSLRGQLARFLKWKLRQANDGKISAGRYESLDTSLTEFVELAETDDLVTVLNSRLLTDYRDVLEEKVSNKELSDYSARDALANAKQFARWAYDEELIDLPRKLNSVDLSISVAPRKIEVFKIEELQHILASPTPDPTRLYILLMLNTGCQQTDIATLRQDEVDWKAGRIKRKRSKTKKHGDSVPTVDYKLWPETFSLLKQFRSEDSTLALTNNNGAPLKTDVVTGGKRKKIDNIQSAYIRVKNRLAKPVTVDGEIVRKAVTIKKPLKLLRKTASSILKKKHPEFVDLFLGHAASTMADKHYAQDDKDQFDDAVLWLRSQLPIEPQD